MQTKIRVKWADHFGQPRKDLSLAELRALQREVEHEVHGPGGLLAKQLKERGLGFEDLAEVVVTATQEFVDLRMASLVARIDRLERERAHD